MEMELFINLEKMMQHNYKNKIGYNSIIAQRDKVTTMLKTYENINSPCMREVLQVVYLHFLHLDIHQSNIYL